MNHSYIGTEHILLGLVREGEGVAATVLVNLGAGLGRVRQEVIKLMSGGQEPSSARRNERAGSLSGADAARAVLSTMSWEHQRRCSTSEDGVPSDDAGAEPISVTVVYCMHCGTTLQMLEADGSS